jgi:hypothetical protein
VITYHAVGTNIRLRLLVVDGLGAGVAGQAPVLAIRRRSDGQYWTGAVWQAGFVELPMVEESAGNLPGSYYRDFDQAVAGGSAEEYLVRYRNPAAPPLRSLDEEQHVFRPTATTLNPERRIAGALADDGATFRIAVWIEEAGQRVTNYNQVAAKIFDPAGNLVVDLNADTTDSAQGVFAFETPIAPIVRNRPYVLELLATRGVVTDSFNWGFVRT